MPLVPTNYDDPEEYINDEDRVSFEEIHYEKETGLERFLIVSNYSRFASVDVWAGIAGAFRDLGHMVLPYSIHNIRAFLSQDMMLRHLISCAVNVRSNFSHVIFVGSTFVPGWVIKSIQRCGVKVLYWSLEDPHALDQNSKFYTLADYYMTNERNVSRNEDFIKSIYLPTGADHNACMPPEMPLEELPEVDRDVVDNDIVFCGNVYPNRQKVLEQIVPFLDEKGYSMAIAGITCFMEDKKKSPIYKHIKREFEGVIDHRYLVLMYGYARMSINLQRESFWEYSERHSTNRKFKIIGESMNPRAYEIALCGGSLQLIDNIRKEATDGLSLKDGKHFSVFKDAKDLCEKIQYYMEHPDERKQIVETAREYCKSNHTYLSRAIRILKFIRLREKRTELLEKAAVKEMSAKFKLLKDGII